MQCTNAHERNWRPCWLKKPCSISRNPFLVPKPKPEKTRRGNGVPASQVADSPRTLTHPPNVRLWGIERSSSLRGSSWKPRQSNADKGWTVWCPSQNILNSSPRQWDPQMSMKGTTVTVRANIEPSCSQHQQHQKNAFLAATGGEELKKMQNSRTPLSPPRFPGSRWEDFSLWICDFATFQKHAFRFFVALWRFLYEASRGSLRDCTILR